MKPNLISYAVGFIFALGLGLSGMTQPAKVIGFLDFAGSWDPSLAFVMGSAVLIYGVGFRWLMGARQKPIFADRFQIPTRKELTPSLILGSALFGIGWGIAGFCPGPAIASVSQGVIALPSLLIFVAAMFAGFGIHRVIDAAISKQA